MIRDGKIHLASSDEKEIYLLPQMANRHGIISGATGTGKTVTLRVLAEDFSSLGVPVFLPDMKGELSGLLAPMNPDEAIQERLEETRAAATYTPEKFPVLFWDLYGEMGIPLRCSPTQMGPVLLSRLLDLNETQAGVMDVVFRIADDRALPILDFKDLKQMLLYTNEHRQEISKVYGNIASSSVSAILRRLLRFEDEGAEPFFGEPSFELDDLFAVDDDGKGVIHILQARELYQSPLLYSSFMLWLLSALFDQLPEVGDVEVPRLAFFFDEAHLLFDALAKPLANKLEQLVRMIRSKGVAVFFVTQSIRDLPNEILSQLGNRVQHGLRAYTPAEQTMVKVTADSFRANPNFDTEEALKELSIGEALISCLDESGVPQIVEKATVLPPRSSLEPIDDYSLRAAYQEHPLYDKYAEALDRESAYELIEAEIADREAEAAREEAERLEAEAKALEEKEAAKAAKEAAKEAEKLRKEAEKEAEKAKAPKRKSSRMTPLERLTNSAFSAVGRELGRSFTRGILGNLRR